MTGLSRYIIYTLIAKDHFPQTDQPDWCPLGRLARACRYPEDRIPTADQISKEQLRANGFSYWLP